MKKLHARAKSLIQLTGGLTGQMRQLNKSIWNFRFVKALGAAELCGVGNGGRERLIAKRRKKARSIFSENKGRFI